MTWEPGKSGNPNGYKGPRDRARREVFERIRGLEHLDALETLSTIQNDPNTDPCIRVAAASALAPYCHPKMQSTPTPRFIDLQLDVPEFTHVSDAENFLAKIALLVARGHLDIQSGQELSALVKTWIDTQYARDELNYKISPPETRDQTIRIEGGLPALPGTSITMPVLNGHAVSEQLLSAPNDVVPPAPQEVTVAIENDHVEAQVVADDAGTNSAPGTNSTNGQGDPSAPPETQDQGPA
jgi:hypothetical protein